MTDTENHEHELPLIQFPNWEPWMLRLTDMQLVVHPELPTGGPGTASALRCLIGEDHRDELLHDAQEEAEGVGVDPLTWQLGLSAAMHDISWCQHCQVHEDVPLDVLEEPEGRQEVASYVLQRLAMHALRTYWVEGTG